MLKNNHTLKGVSTLQQRIRHRFGGILLVILSLFGISLATAPPATASAPVLLSGSSWLGGNGVNVCAPSTDPYCGNDYHVGGWSGNWWQCVELAQRLYQARGWHSGIFPGVSYAYQIYDQAPAMGMSRQANNSISSLAPGDMIIHGSDEPYTANAGHVSIVDSVSGSTVNVVEQNTYNNDPTGQYTLSGGTLSRSGSGTIRGVVHDPGNQNSGGGSNRRMKADIDGDSKDDLLWFEPRNSAGQPQLSTFRSTGTGFSRLRNDIWGAPAWAGVGDFTGDGKADIAWYEPTSGCGYPQLSILTSTGAGYNRAWTACGWAKPTWAGVGDFTGDGKADIAWYEPTSSCGHPQLSIFASTGSGFNRVNTQCGWGNPTWAGVGDYNGDGKSDIAWFEPRNSTGQTQLSIFGSTGSGFSRLWNEYGWGAPSWASAGDFTGDGKDDLAYFEPRNSAGQPQLSVFRSSGSGFSRSWTEIWGAPRWAGVGDVTGDGKSDLLWFEPRNSAGQPQLSVFRSTGGSFSRQWNETWGAPDWASSGTGSFYGTTGSGAKP